ncbi:MAG: hypothetical protein ACLGI3_16815 [Actinomycetes bacterium]
MRRGGTVRGVFAGFLGLVALHAVGTKGGGKRVEGAFGDLAAIVERVLANDVPAIPDRRTAAPAADETQWNATARTAPRLPIPSPPK